MLQGRIAVVTGSTSGIGLSIAKSLARAGAHIVLNGMGDAGSIAEAQALVLEAGKSSKVLFHPADMGKPNEVVELITFATEQLGTVDILVNNAGVQYTSPIEEFPEENWDQIIAINLSAAFHSTKASLPLMKDRGWGRIINIASVHGLVASTCKAAYVAAKHGLVGFTKVVALETAGSGITCNAVCPGWVRTPLVERQITDLSQRKQITQVEQKMLLLEKQPSGQFIEADHIGELVVFLCSEPAAGITGASLPIDGGWTAC